MNIDKLDSKLKESFDAYNNLFRINIEKHPVVKLNRTARESYLLILNDISKNQLASKKKTKMMVQLYESTFMAGSLLAKNDATISWRNIKKKHRINLECGTARASLRYLLILDILLLAGKVELEGPDGKWMVNLQDDYIEKIRRKLNITKKEMGCLCRLFKALEDQKIEEAEEIVKVYFSNPKYSIIQYFYHQKIQLSYHNNSEEFKIAVLATMSAGKSTVINTLLGQELLPSRNQACTNNVVEIHQNNSLDRYIGYAFNQMRTLDYQPSVTAENLKEWNERENNHIAIEGRLSLMEKTSRRIVLIDTPGPNNSSSQEHEQRTLERMARNDYHVIIYILNATQLACDDDGNFLLKVKKLNKPVVFILNKIDTYDLEGDDNIQSALKETESYLQEIGFSDPYIIPFSAYATILFLKGLKGQTLSRKETKDFYNFYEMFAEEEYNMKHYIRGVDEAKILKYKNMLQKCQQVVTVDEKRFSAEEIKERLGRTGFYYLQHILNIG